jgi:hypothetical protein
VRAPSIFGSTSDVGCRAQCSAEIDTSVPEETGGGEENTKILASGTDEPLVDFVPRPTQRGSASVELPRRPVG